MRHLSYAVSTVLGLAAPTVAALLLTASTPGLAAVPAPAAEHEARLHAPTFAVAVPEPVAQQPVPVAVTSPLAAPVTAPVTASVAAPVASPVASPVAEAARTALRHAAPAHRPATRPTPRHVTRPTSATPTRTAPPSTAQPSGADDYPYRTQSDYYAVDQWGFTERQCVSFAAWRLAQHGHTISNNDNWGSALHWDTTARSLGYTVTSTPRVGAIAQWHADEGGAYYGPGSASPNGQFVAGGYGHVAWVMSVYSDGSVLVEQYNMGGDRAYSVMRVKAPRYIVL